MVILHGVSLMVAGFWCEAYWCQQNLQSYEGKISKIALLLSVEYHLAVSSENSQD